MDLRIKDIVDLLDLPEKKVVQMIKDNEIPAYKVKNQYYFNKGEINEWILKNNVKVSSKILDIKLTEKPVLISRLVEKGGIHYDISGKNVKEVIKNAVKTIPIPPETARDIVVSSLLEREEMMTTAVGSGIAFPHPRNPIIADVENEAVSICFLKNKVDFNALDKELVYILFIIISSNSKRHLEILSKISFMCQQPALVNALKDTKEEVILKSIETIETEWGKR